MQGHVFVIIACVFHECMSAVQAWFALALILVMQQTLAMHCDACIYTSGWVQSVQLPACFVV